MQVDKNVIEKLAERIEQAKGENESEEEAYKKRNKLDLQRFRERDVDYIPYNNERRYKDCWAAGEEQTAKFIVLNYNAGDFDQINFVHAK